MIEIEGIIFAKNPKDKLLLIFINSIQRIYDITKLFDKDIYKFLQDEKMFNTAFVDNVTVVWNENLDIEPDELHENSISVVESKQIF